MSDYLCFFMAMLCVFTGVAVLVLGTKEQPTTERLLSLLLFAVAMILVSIPSLK